MRPISLPFAVVIDANILIAICSKEQQTYQTAKDAFDEYARQGAEFFAPNVIVAEVLFVLCRKLDAGILTAAEHEKAVEFFQDYLTIISLSPDGEAALVKRAEEIRSAYGCSRTSDGLYIALAEELAKNRPTEFLTFDAEFTNQVAKNAPSVKVNLLPI
ncbi:MAG: type II toxin-antitoxin system VapC family toxin [Acidobacteriota bacterium]|nr:type II toxin-antitoxin system VapC family toxin [Acidobacteriota bacterium]